MPKQLQLLGGETGRDLELPLQSLAPHAFDALPSGWRQVSVGQPAVVRIIDTRHQAVALEVIDQPGDVSRRNVEPLGQFTEWELVVRCGGERKQNMETTLAQPVLLGPAVHQLTGEPGGLP